MERISSRDQMRVQILRSSPRLTPAKENKVSLPPHNPSRCEINTLNTENVIIHMCAKLYK